jgi:TP901 family phage tail tape measure protein
MQVGVLKVSLQIDTIDFKRAIKEIEQQLKTVAAQGVPKINTKGFADVNAAANEMKKALGAALPVADQLTKRLGEQEKQHAILTQALQKTIDKHGEGSLAAQKQELALQKLANNIDQTKAALAKIDSAATQADHGIAKIGKSAEHTTSQLEALKRVALSVGSVIAASLTAAAAGLAAGLAYSIKNSADFQQAMARVQSITNASANDFAMLSNAAKEMGATTKFTATEAADALAFLGMAGYKASEAVDALPGVLNLAAATNMDLARAADIVSNILGGMNLPVAETSRVVDVLAHVSTSANTNVEQLGEAMKYVAPIAAQAGYSIEATATMIGVLSDAGLQGSEAGTGLRRVILSLSAPTDRARELMEQLGITTRDATTGAMLPMTEIIPNMQRAMEGLSEAEKARAIQIVFGTEGQAAFNILAARGADELANLIGKTDESSGAAQRMADLLQNTVYGAWTKLTSAIDAVTLAIGTRFLPIIQQVLEALTLLVSNSLPMIERVMDTLFSYMSGLASNATGWGEGIGNNFAAGIISAASSVVSALMDMGSIVAYWLTPQSPPPLLPDLDIWGRDTAQVYLDAFSTADASVLQSLGSEIKTVFSSFQSGILATGKNTAQGMDIVSATIQEARDQALKLAETYQDIDSASSDVTRTQMTQAQAQERLTAVTEAYERVLTPLRKQLQGIKDAEDAINREQRIKELQDQISGTRSEAEEALDPIKQQLRDIAKEKKKAALLKDIEKYKKAAQNTNPEKAQTAAIKLAQAQLELQALELEHQIDLEDDKKRQIDRTTEARKAQLELDRIATEQSIDAIERQRDASLEAAQAIADAMKAATSGGGAKGKGVDEAAKKAEEAKKAQEAYAFSVATTSEKLDIVRKKLEGVEEGSAEYYQLLGQVAQLSDQEFKEQTALRQQQEKDAQARVKAERDYQMQIADTAGKLGILRGELDNVEVGSVEYYSILGQISSLEAQAAREAEALAKGIGGVKGALGGGIGGITMPEMPTVPEPTAPTVSDAVDTQYNETLQSVKDLKLELQDTADMSEVTRPINEFAVFLKENLLPAITGAAFALTIYFIPAMATAAGAALAAVGAFATMIAPILAVIAAGALLGVAWSQNFMGIQDITFTVLDAIKGIITSGLDFIVAFWAQNGQNITASATEVWNNTYNTIMLFVENLKTGIMLVVGVIVAFWEKHGATIMEYAKKTWDKVYNIIYTNALLIWEVIKLSFTVISTIITTVLSIIQKVVITAWGFISTAIQDNMSLIELIIGTGWETIKNVIDLALGVIQGIIDTVLGIITGDWDKARAGVEKIVESLVTFVKNQFEVLKNFVMSIGPEMLEIAKGVGTAIIEGITKGISNGAEAIKNAAKSAAKSALDAAKGFLGIDSPSKVFQKDVGENIVAGMALGLKNIDPVERAMGDMIDSIIPSGSGAITNTTNWNVNINTTQPTSNVLSGLALRQRLVGG